MPNRFADAPVLNLIRILQHPAKPLLGEVRLGHSRKDTLDVRLALVIEEHSGQRALHCGIQFSIRPSQANP